MKFVSIVGDSISTFEGYNPQGYSVFYDEYMQRQNGLKSVYDTWWAKVNQALHAYLCVNNSYSGSKVSGKGFPSGWSDERLLNLNTPKYCPDIVLLYLGTNDFCYGINIEKSSLSSSAKDTCCFEDAYDIMLGKIKLYYPSAKIICGTLMRTIIKGRDNWEFPERYAGKEFESYNETIRKIVRKNNCYLADVSLTGRKYETMDGAHPTAKGHQTIADAWIKCIMAL